jgi:tetratricopeptide (TPR) repeat protein
VLTSLLIALALAATTGDVPTPPRAPVPAPAEDAQAALARGMAQAERGDYAAARASFDEALRQDPALKEARLMRGVALGALGQVDAALADLEAAGDLVPPAKLLEIKGALLLDARRYPEAIAAYEALTRLQPDSAEAFKRLGHARQFSEIQGQGDAALADYARALALNPDYLEVYGLRGEILAARRDADGVDRNYQAWIARAPDDADAHASYAEALVRVDKRDAARAEVERALAIKPTAQAYLTRASLTPNDQREAILADIDKALVLAPRQTTFAYLLRARKQAQWGEFDLALADVDRALDAWPESLGARIMRYQLHQRAARYDAAQADLDLLVARDPDASQYRNDRCWNRVLANRELDKALVDCNAALRLDPGDAAALDSRGWVRLRQGDARAAIVDFDAALAIMPKLPASLFGRGVAFRRLGETAKGDADLSAARAADPGVEARFAGYGVTP